MNKITDFFSKYWKTIIGISGAAAVTTGVYLTTVPTTTTKTQVYATTGKEQVIDWSFSMIDACFTKGWECRDIFAEPYATLIKNWTSNSITMNVGSTADYALSIIGDTAWLGGRGNGYNCNAEGLDGVCFQNFMLNGKAYAFNNAIWQLSKNNGVPLATTLNMQRGSLTQALWQAQSYRLSKGIYGAEQQLNTYVPFWKEGGKSYCDTCNRWDAEINRNVKNYTSCFWAAPVLSDIRKDVNWNIAQKNNNVKAAGQYLQLDNLQGAEESTFTGEIDKDTAKMVNIIRNGTLVISQFFQTFPAKDLWILQTGTANAFNPTGKVVYPNTFFASTFLARKDAAELQWNDTSSHKIKYDSYQNAKNAISGKDSVNWNYRFEEAKFNAFNEAGNTVILTNNQGLLVYGMKTNSGKIKLVVCNYTGKDVNMFNNITLDGVVVKVKTPNKTCYYANSITDTQVNSYILTETIKGYSIGEIEITLK